MKKLRVAVIGAGFIAVKRHLPAWHRLNSRAEVVGLSDLNLEMARETASRFGVSRVYGDADRMLADVRPDVVDICTPPASHAAMAGLGVRWDCHMLIEKPMALSLTDCDSIIRAAEARRLKVCVAHTGLFYEPFIRGRRMVESGAIGEFRGMRIVISTPTDYMTASEDHWAHKLPGGTIGETGPHPVYMSLPFIKGVKCVRVEGLKILPQYPWSQFEDYRIDLIGEKAVSSISINYATSQWMVWVEMAGSEGTLLLDLHGRSVVRMRRNRLRPMPIGLSVLGGGAQLVKEALLSGIKFASGRTLTTHDRLISAFADSLLAGTALPVTAEEGREAVRVMAMISGQLQRQSDRAEAVAGG
jgi:predicted dehydrogenase